MTNRNHIREVCTSVCLPKDRSCLPLAYAVELQRSIIRKTPANANFPSVNPLWRILNWVCNLITRRRCEGIVHKCSFKYDVKAFCFERDFQRGGKKIFSTVICGEVSLKFSSFTAPRWDVLKYRKQPRCCEIPIVYHRTFAPLRWKLMQNELTQLRSNLITRM